jgi:hypothetical protein
LFAAQLDLDYFFIGKFLSIVDAAIGKTNVILMGDNAIEESTMCLLNI